MEENFPSNDRRYGFLVPTIFALIVYLGANTIFYANYTGRLEKIAREEGTLKARQAATEKITQYDNIFKEVFLWGVKSAAENYLANTKP